MRAKESRKRNFEVEVHPLSILLYASMHSAHVGYPKLQEICVLCSVVDPDPHQFADDKPKCMEYEPI